MKKNIIKISFIIILAIMLSACSNTNQSKSIDNIPGLYYYTGKFSVFVPSGWSAIPYTDIDDKYNNYFVYIIKKEGLAIGDKFDEYPYMIIKYYPSDKEYVEPSILLYDNVNEMSITINNQEWNGFSDKHCIILWTKYIGDTYIETMIYHKDTISIDDYDVKSILAKIKY